MLNICFGYRESLMLNEAIGEEFTYGHRHLDLGKIHPVNFENSRLQWIVKFYTVGLISEREKLWQEDCKRFNNIIERAKEDKIIRVWQASSPCSTCGFYHLVYSLKDIDCKIFVVEMPKDAGYRDSNCDRAWAEAKPEEMVAALKNERELSANEREKFTQYWEILQQEDAQLRLNVDGKITSLSIDYLDEEILSYAPAEEKFTLGSLVATTLKRCPHAVSDAFIAQRVESLIERGLIMLVGERPKKRYDYYSKTKLIKVCSISKS